jgi:Holliday junction resolvase
MEILWLFVGTIAVLLIVLLMALYFRKPNLDKRSQKELDKYLKGPFSNADIGTLYERYIGHLYEVEGYDVIYHGALNGVRDIGIDLIAKNEEETHLVQTKCWAKRKVIGEKHIFQLYGSATYFEKTQKVKTNIVKPVFYTPAKYSKVAIEAAEVLGVDLIESALDSSYPMIKCNINQDGEKIYHLPFDPFYDKVKIKEDGEFFARTVKEAAEKGFRRAGLSAKKTA